MYEEMINALVALVIGGLLGGFLKTYYDHRKEVVSAIWEKRFGEYKKLWLITGVLPSWPKDEAVTSEKLYDTCMELKNWYFSDGGMLLSRKSRIAYGKVQERLFQTAGKRTGDRISDKDYEEIRKAFSRLRTEMTKDLTSRSKQIIK